MCDKIREAREAAATARARAAESSDPRTAGLFLQIAWGWMHIADDLEFLERKNADLIVGQVAAHRRAI